MSTTTTQSSFSVSCDTSGNAVSQNQMTLTNYYIDGILIGQNAANTSLNLQQFKNIVAALNAAD